MVAFKGPCALSKVSWSFFFIYTLILHVQSWNNSTGTTAKKANKVRNAMTNINKPHKPDLRLIRCCWYNRKIPSQIDFGLAAWHRWDRLRGETLYRVVLFKWDEDKVKGSLMPAHNKETTQAEWWYWLVLLLTFKLSTDHSSSTFDKVLCSTTLQYKITSCLNLGLYNVKYLIKSVFLSLGRLEA